MLRIKNLLSSILKLCACSSEIPFTLLQGCQLLEVEHNCGGQKDIHKILQEKLKVYNVVPQK